MKKTVFFVIISVLMTIILVGCTTTTPSKDEINIEVVKELEVSKSYDFSCNVEVEWSFSEEGFVKIEANKLIPLKEGEVYLIATQKSNKSNTEKVKLSITDNTFPITYIDGGDLPSDAPTYYLPNNMISLPVPTKIAHEFKGWYDNDEFTGEAISRILSSQRGEVVLYGKWERIVYAISYATNGGKWGSIVPVREYSEDSEDIILPSPSKDKYTFIGWFNSKGEQMTVIPKGSTANYSLTAKWQDNVMPSSIEIGSDKDNYIMNKAENWVLNAKVLPNDVSNPNLIITSSDPLVAEVINGVIKAKSYGQTTLLIYAEADETVNWSCTINVVPTLSEEKPTIYLINGASNNIIIKDPNKIDLVKNVKAQDITDGDITSSIIIDNGGFDGTSFGEFDVVYSVTNSANQTATLNRKIIYNEVIYVGHRGSKLGGVENTEEAFLTAINAGFTSLETDIKVTKDGVLVCWHDDGFSETRYSVDTKYKSYTIAGKNWSELKDIEITQKVLHPTDRSKVLGTYTSKLCTFERYLEICKDNNVIPVIEIKAGTGLTNSNFSNAPVLVKMIKDAGLWDKAIIMTSQRNFLEHIRNNYAGATLQWLCGSTVNDYKDWAFSNRISLDISWDYCTKELVEEAHSYGLFVNIYTMYARYQSKTQFQKFLDWGVDMITSDDVLSINDIPAA